MDDLLLISELSPYLDKYESKNGKHNFRCPICGDSKKSKFRKRAWFISKDSKYFFHCFNCSLTLTVKQFAKEYFPEVYKRFLLENLKSKDNYYPTVHHKKQDDTSKISNLLKSRLIPCSDDAEILRYLKSRKIPEKYFKEIFVSNDFSQLVKDIEKFKDTNFPSEKRIVIPIYNENGDIVSLISRGLKKGSIRYINLKFTEKTYLFGMFDSSGKQKIDYNKKIYVTEGSIDSMFLDNSIAVSTSDLLIAEKTLSEFTIANLQFVFVPDNDKRNKEIINVYEKILKTKHSIVIFPDYVSGKDINEIILNNYDIHSLISSNTFSGLKALIEFTKWKRV